MNEVRKVVARCVICDFEVESTEGLKGCPKCGTTSIPCDPAEDVTVKINWHELRILGLWAERWADANPDAKPNMRQLVISITRRLEVQEPKRARLMLSREIADLKKEYPDLQTNVPLSEGFDPTQQ